MEKLIVLFSLCLFFFDLIPFVYRIGMNNKPTFLGDYRTIDPSFQNAINKVNILSGDTGYDDDDNDEGQENAISSVGDISNDSDPNDFLSGDVDLEYESSQLAEGDFLEGGVLKKMFNRKKKAGRNVSATAFNKTANQVLTNQSKILGGVFPKNLVAQKELRKIVDSGESQDVIEAKITQLAASNKVSGAITENMQVSRIVVSGGLIKIAETLLKIPGSNLVNAVKLYEAQYPGLSRTFTAIAPSTGLVSAPFAAPTGQDVTKIIGIFIIITAPPLTRVTDAEIGITITGKINTVTVTYSKDRISLFRDGGNKTLIAILPTLTVRQSLYVVPYDVPAADPNDLQIDLSGVPEGSNVVVRLPGVDSTEWGDYKAMFGLK